MHDFIEDFGSEISIRLLAFIYLLSFYSHTVPNVCSGCQAKKKPFLWKVNKYFIIKQQKSLCTVDRHFLRLRTLANQAKPNQGNRRLNKLKVKQEQKKSLPFSPVKTIWRQSCFYSFLIRQRKTPCKWAYNTQKWLRIRRPYQVVRG